MNSNSKSTSGSRLASWLIGTGCLVLVVGTPQGVIIYFWPSSFGVKPEIAASTGLYLSVACILVGTVFNVLGEFLIRKIKRKNAQEICA